MRVYEYVRAGANHLEKQQEGLQSATRASALARANPHLLRFAEMSSILPTAL